MLKKSNPIIKSILLSLLLFAITFIVIQKTNYKNVTNLLLIQNLIILIPVYIIKNEQKLLQDLNKKTDWAKTIAKAIKYYFYFLGIMIMIQAVSIGFNIQIPFFGEQAIPQDFLILNQSIFIIIWISLIAPIIEELYFRNFIWNNLRNKNRNIIQASLFAIFHLEASTLGPLFIYGMLLGKIRERYGIYAAITLHIINNSLATAIILNLQKFSI